MTSQVIISQLAASIQSCDWNSLGKPQFLVGKVEISPR